ncbi:hypothetical protein [Deinococcus ruber]|nr:hypothetical protein [Deinococcus ruber]
MFMFPSTARRLLTLCSVGLAPLWAAPALAAPVPDPPPDRAILSYPALRPVVNTSIPVALLFSDSPETPETSGLLYRDTVTGRARVLAYHANGLSTLARVRLLARNTGTQATHVELLRQGSATVPGPDPLVGQQTLLRYFASGPRLGRTLQPGESAALYDSGPLLPDSVVSLLLDLDTSGPLELSVVIVGEKEQPDSLQLGNLPTLAPDQFHQRGTFMAAQRTLSFVLPAGAAPVRLVLGGPDDPPLQGRDMLTGAAQQLKGNFGVLYDISLEGAAGRLLAASPRGGLYQGSLLLQDGQAPSQVLLGQGQALLDPAAPAFLWQLRTQRQRLLFVPANGSNMPLALVFYPRNTNRPPKGK